VGQATRSPGPMNVSENDIDQFIAAVACNDHFRIELNTSEAA
jgi:hypothetical protein